MLGEFLDIFANRHVTFMEMYVSRPSIWPCLVFSEFTFQAVSTRRAEKKKEKKVSKNREKMEKQFLEMGNFFSEIS